MSGKAWVYLGKGDLNILGVRKMKSPLSANIDALLLLPFLGKIFSSVTFRVDEVVHAI